MDDHVRWMIKHRLEHLVFLEKQLGEFGVLIELRLKPLEREYELLQTIAGVGAR